MIFPDKYEVHVVHSKGMKVVQFHKKKEAEQYATNIIKSLAIDYKKTRRPNTIIITLEDGE